MPAAFSKVPLEYGNAFAAAVRVRTRAGEPPVLRMLWANESGTWRIVTYDLETP